MNRLIKTNEPQFVKNKYKRVVNLINNDTKILDIGCHDGGILNYLIEKNCKYFGADINEEMLTQLRNQGVTVEKVDLNKNSLPFKGQKFDYILFLDVLEHILDPKQILSKAKEKLSEDGKIILTLPNDYHVLNKIRFIFNRPMTLDPFAPYGHLHYFPIKFGEELLIKGQGFEILKRIFIPPHKPSFLPHQIKSFLGNNFPQNFARTVLYFIQPIKWNTN